MGSADRGDKSYRASPLHTPDFLDTLPHTQWTFYEGFANGLYSNRVFDSHARYLRPMVLLVNSPPPQRLSFACHKRQPRLAGKVNRTAERRVG